jgi:hypothetical protein
MLIYGSPEVVSFPFDFEKDEIGVPLVACLTTPVFQFIGVRLSEFQAPLTDRFVGQHDPTLGHDFFDITETEGEADIQPDAVTNNLGWEAIPFGEGGRCLCFHVVSMPEVSAFQQVDSTLLPAQAYGISTLRCSLFSPKHAVLDSCASRHVSAKTSREQLITLSISSYALSMSSRKN